MSWVRWILARVFDCPHRRITWPHRDDRGFDYVCCLECGKELPYSTRQMRVVTSETLSADRKAEHGTALEIPNLEPLSCYARTRIPIRLDARTR